MRIAIISILTLLLISCNNEDAPNCFKSAGDRVSEQIVIEQFDKLEINNQFNVIIEQAEEQEIRLDYFDNLVSDVTFELRENLLIVSDNNSCNWVREYSFPTLRIKHPNLIFIRQNGGGLISSKDTLRYPTLELISEDRSGDFDLTINNQELSIVNNDLTNYYIDGKTSSLSVGFFSGDGRFEGQNLECQDVNVFHRATNDIIVNAQNSLTGRILGNGNLIFADSKPAIIDVSIESRGRLIDRTN